MFPVPLTFLYDFENCSEKMYPVIMEEFASNGAKHLVLSDTLIDRMTRKSSNISAMEKYMQTSGLSFCDAHGIFGPEWCLNCPNKALKNAMLHQQKLALDLCQYFGVKTITIHVGSMRPLINQKISREAHIEAMKDSLAELVPYAEKNDVVICIENIWHHINMPEALLEVKKEFPSPHLGFCFDAGHANVMDKGRLAPEGAAWEGWRFCGVDTPQWDDKILDKMLPYIVNCHIHDNDGTKDAHDLPGRGNIDWKKVFSKLLTAPNLKVIQSEVLPVNAGVSIPLLCKTFRELEEKYS